MSNTSHVKSRIDQLLEERGLRTADFIRGIGMNVSTYYDIWKRDYLTLDRLVAMAEFLSVPPSALLPGEPAESWNDQGSTVSEPAPTYGKRYIEQRIEWLETEVRKLKEDARPR
jgi:transcriptional regulator with XRE-family HTH domain